MTFTHGHSWQLLCKAIFATLRFYLCAQKQIKIDFGMVHCVLKLTVCYIMHVSLIFSTDMPQRAEL